VGIIRSPPFLFEWIIDMNDTTKRTLLISLAAIVILVAVFVDPKEMAKGAAKDAAVEKIDTTQKQICLNAFNAIKIGSYETKITEQQLLLSASSGKDNAGVIKANLRLAELKTVRKLLDKANLRLAELKTVRKLLDKVVNNPKLNCVKHLGEEYTLIKK